MQTQIRLDKLDWIKARVAKLNKLAEKRALAPWTLAIGDIEVVSIDGLHIDAVNIEIVGDPPVVPGHKLRGMRLRRDGAPFFVGDLPARYRELQKVPCHHCNTVRKRNDFAVVETPEGHEMVIGRTCLKDYFGVPHAESLIAYARMERELTLLTDPVDDEESSVGYAGGYATQRYLAACVYHIAKYGWMSSTAAVEQLVCPTWVEVADGYNRMLPSSQEMEKAARIIEYHAGLDLATCSTFDANLKTFLSERYLGNKMLAFAAASITAFDRAMEKAKESDSKPSEFVGTVGKRQELSLTYKGRNSYENAYGTTTIWRFEDDGNSVVWKTSSSLKADYTVSGKDADGDYSYRENYRPQAGDIITLKARIDRHEPYQRQFSNDKPVFTTYITRPKALRYEREGHIYELF